MPAPPPYEGPCKECDRANTPDAEVPKNGQYRGICVDCRPKIVEQRRLAREARPPDQPPGDDDGPGRTTPTKKQPKLKDACLYLAAKAEALEQALDAKKIAHREAQAALRVFKEQLTLVSRVAQSMLNQATTKADE